VASRSFSVGKMNHELGKDPKKYSQKHIPFLTVFDRVLSRKDMAFSGGFRTKMSVCDPILRRYRL